ncbi:MAG: NUDIX hydrolase [Candidatus Bathyarchaeota archaeon]|nr:NUDIX hydrolase [Candidatus Bathyarchaeota archaeon]
MYPEQPVVGIGSVILKEGEIVLIQRGNEPGRGKWTIPGGLVEVGEHLEQTVIRETKEEINLDVINPTLVDVVDNVDYDAQGKIKYHYVILQYHVQVIGGKLKADSDALDVQWVHIDNVEEYDLTASFRAFFRKNKRKLEKLTSYPEKTAVFHHQP